MGEQYSGQPESELDSLGIAEVSLRQWHGWLTTDQATGEPAGDLQVPCSRYGRNSAEVAWWAIAAGYIYEEVSGPHDNPPEAMNFMMGLAVNSHEDIEYMVIEYWHALPDELKDQLDVDGLR